MGEIRIGSSLDEALAALASPAVASVISAIARASLPVVAIIRSGPLAGALGAATGADNADGDTQKALDVLADRQFSEGLKGAGVRAIASEEMNEPLAIDADGTVLVAIDPLDGSSNIDANVSIGTIFSLLAAPQGRAPETADFLQPGSRQLAAGFIIYGPQTSLIFSTGAGTHMATLDPDGNRYVMTRLSLSIPEASAEFAINASNYRHWHKPVQAYIDDCIEGADGPRGKNFNMRWIASLVADAYRIAIRGGVFLYPGDKRKGYERGRLRHVYEANPIALLIEQAGGQATDGINRLLDQVPQGLHARIPVIFGSADKVARVRRYHVEFGSAVETSPLFGKRGLLRG